MSLLRTLAWLVCGIYATVPAFWLAIHPFASRWRGMRSRYSLIVPMWMAMWIVAWAASAPWAQSVLYHRPWTWAIALTLFYVSFHMYTGGTRGLSLTLIIGRHELEPDSHSQRLVTSGVHGMVRHPLYLGHLCSMLGLAVGAGSVACFALTAFAIVTGAIMIPVEERELRERFGEEYDRYSERVPRIFPRLFRSAP